MKKQMFEKISKLARLVLKGRNKTLDKKLWGFFKGMKISEKEIEEAKKSLFPEKHTEPTTKEL